jgi:protein SCO1/2
LSVAVHRGLLKSVSIRVDLWRESIRVEPWPVSIRVHPWFKTAIVSAVLAIALAGCSSGRRYELRGQVLAVNPERQEITVKHEDIKGFMPGMTMPFKVRDRALLEGRAPGEMISATLVVGTDEAYLEDIRRTGEAPLTESAPTAGTFDLLDPGAIVPDEPLVDQDGRSRRLSDWRQKAVAVTFIYTRCPLPDFCPLMDGHFAAVQKQVAADPVLRGRVQLVSVSFDPVFDKPSVLAAHARRVGADPSSWSFVTGDTDDIDRFASRFGVSIIREDTPTQEIVHNLRTAVIDGAGRLVRVISGNDWKPAELVAELRKSIERR